MTPIRNCVPCVAATLVSGLCATASLADTVEMRRLNDGQGRNITRLGIAMPPGGLNIFIGEFINEFQNGTGVGALITGTQANFCIDLTQEHSVNWEVFDVVPLAFAPEPPPNMGLIKAQGIADVTSGAGAAAHSSNDNAAAMQMLIWEIIGDYDGTIASINTTAGNVRYSSGAGYYPAVLAAFNTFSSYLGSGGNLAVLYGVTNPNFQDHMVIIPAPGAAGLALVGLLAMSSRRRRA